MGHSRRGPSFQQIVLGGLAIVTFPSSAIWLLVYAWLRHRGYRPWGALGGALGLMMGGTFLLILLTTMVMLVSGAR
jgi:hypothetical protein